MEKQEEIRVKSSTTLINLSSQMLQVDRTQIHKFYLINIKDNIWVILEKKDYKLNPLNVPRDL